MQVRLDLLVGDYVKNAQRAGKATSGIGDAAAAPRSALQGLTQVGADLGRTMVATAGVGVAALAGWTASAVGAGVAYNSLQQTAGSALETLMGSAEAAAAQMEELTAFARESPFPKQLWIQAQQTLIGFGVEAEKVVPIFSALQDGVVAVGGSAQSIEEVVLILSKISSVGKVTAEDLNELGVRGIDAATLVGEAWGMTAAEVRDSMSKGTVDATEFMDTLVAELGTKYAGAAEGLRTTWVGALDRIKGATRDVGSAIAEPFIDPQGGGAAVQWANDVADALRAFEAVLRPAIDVLSERAEPAFIRASEAMQRFTESIGELDLVAVLDRLSAGAPIFTAFGAAAAAAGSASALSAVGMGGLAAAINPVAAGILGLAVASPAFRDVLGDLMTVIAPLIPVIADLAVQIAEGLVLAIDSLMPFVEVAIGLVGGMIGLFSSLPEPIQQASVAIGLFALALKRLGPIGIILSGIAFIATAVSSIGGESEQASIDVNDLAEDLKNLQTLGRTFKIQEADFSGITGPLRDAMDLIELRSEQAGMAYEGNITEAVRQSGADMEAFTKAVDTVDDALTQLVSEGTDAEEALRLVGEATGMSQDELALILPLLDDYNAAAEVQAETNAQAAAEQEEFTNKVGASVAVLQELADELRAQVDPVFAAVRAMQAYGEAQDAYNEAVKEHGAASEEAIEAEMALIEAYLDAAAAAGEMAQATGGDLPLELLHAAEAAGLGEEALALLEEQFYNTRDAGQQMGDDLSGVNADLTTSTGQMAAVNGLVYQGMAERQAQAIVQMKAAIDQLIAAGWSYEDAIAYVSQQSNVATSVIEQGFQDARDKGLEFSDDYPAEIRLTGYDSALSQIQSLGRAIHEVPSYKRVVIEYSQEGRNAPSGDQEFATGGRVLGPRGAGDVVPAMLTPEEHVWTPEEVQAAGGHEAMYAMRAAVLAGRTQFAQSGPAPVYTASAGGSSRPGIHVDTLRIESVGASFDTRQVMNALAYEGTV